MSGTRREFTADDPPVVDGILVTFERPHELLKSLQAIAAQELRPRRLWIVDNGRRPAPVEWIKNQLDVDMDVRHIVSGENLGPAGGFAHGLDFALAEDSPEWLALFDDNDPPTSSRILAALVDSGRKLVQAGNPVGGVGLRGGRMQWLRGRVVLPSEDEVLIEVDHLHGGYVPVYRVAALYQCPNFQQELFFGFEELAFGLGICNSGFALFVDGSLWAEVASSYPKAVVRHRPRLRSVESPRRRYYSLRNLIWLLRRHGHPVVAFRVAVSRGLAKPLLNLFMEPHRGTERLRLSIRAVVDAYRGNMGRTIELDTPCCA